MCLSSSVYSQGFNTFSIFVSLRRQTQNKLLYSCLLPFRLENQEEIVTYLLVLTNFFPLELQQLCNCLLLSSHKLLIHSPPLYFKTRSPFSCTCLVLSSHKLLSLSLRLFLRNVIARNQLLSTCFLLTNLQNFFHIIFFLFAIYYRSLYITASNNS